MTVKEPSKRFAGRLDGLVLRTLGQASLSRVHPGGDPVQVLGPGKPLAMVVYLAMTPRRVAMRDELIDLLWSHSPVARARATLRQTLSQLRSHLGDDALLSEGQVVQLVADISTDARDFLGAVESGEVRQAMDLYAGAFLPNLSFPGGSAFEHWADIERRRLDAAFRHVTESETRRALADGRLRDAQVAARALLESDRSRESSWRLLLEALQSSSDDLALALHSDALERMLEEEEVEPEPATLAALKRARRAADAHVVERGETALRAELVGREHEFSVLTNSLSRIQHGAREHVHISAPSGLGKSRLLSDFERRVRATGGRVIHATANIGERRIPYALAADVANALSLVRGSAGLNPRSAGVLVGLAPGLATRYPAHQTIAPTTSEIFLQRTLALSDLLEAVAHEGAITILIDDLHWSDAVSRQVLAGLIHRLPARTLVVTASRSITDWSSKEGSLVSLSGLDQLAVSSLLASIGFDGEGDAEQVVSALTTGTAGSPHLILETLQLSIERAALRREGEVLRLVDADAFLAIVRQGDATARRLGLVSNDQQGVLEVLAVYGRPATTETLTQLSRLNTERLDAAIVELASHRLIVESGAGWQILHDAIAEPVLAAIPVPRRQELHGAIGNRLARDASTDAEFRLALEHLMASGSERAANTVFKVWLRGRRLSGDGRSARALASELLAGEVSTQQLRRIVRSVPLLQQPAVRHRYVAALTLLFVVALSAYIPFRFRGPTLVVAQRPIVLRNVGPGLPSLVPTPVVELRDRRGRRVTAPDTVTVRVVEGEGRVEGPTRAAVVDGRASFPNLRLSDSGSVVLEFRSQRSGQTVQTAFENRANEPPRLRFVSAVFDGDTLYAPAFETTAGRHVRGEVTVRYSSGHPFATIIYGMSPTWGDPANSVQSIAAVRTPALDDERTDAISFTAPARPGLYYLLFAIGAETDAQFLFSRTNYMVGSPDWTDGNELADLPTEQIKTAALTGNLISYVLRLDQDGNRTRGPDTVGLTAIAVVVR